MLYIENFIKDVHASSNHESLRTFRGKRVSSFVLMSPNISLSLSRNLQTHYTMLKIIACSCYFDVDTQGIKERYPLIFSGAM